MGSLSDFLNDYEVRNPGFRESAEKLAAEFLDDSPEVVDKILPEVSWTDCTAEHPDLAGPNMDIGQCATCWAPMGVMRPYGESFGWHSGDCSLPMRHPGYCVGGGNGHVIPGGWKLRG